MGLVTRHPFRLISMLCPPSLLKRPALPPSRRVRVVVLGLCALLWLSNAIQAASWWQGEWGLRKKVTLVEGDHGATVLVRLHEGDFSFPAAKEDGTDLRFVTADDKTLLPYHLEKYDSLLNEAFVWVKVPESAMSFWLYYSNSGPQAVRVEDAKATYDADTVLAYHFSEKGTPAHDATGHGNDASNPGVASEGSMIGGGLRLNGKGTVTIPASPSLNWSEGAALTWSAWIKPTALSPNAVLFSREEGANAWRIGVDNGTPFVEVAGASGTQRSGSGAPMAVNSWHQLAVTASGGKMTVYLDGESYATLAAAVPALSSAAQIGSDTAGFQGELDELEIAQVARSAEFLKFSALNQGADPVKTVTLGADEQPSSWLSWLSTGYFGIIFKSLTLDGWVVIGLLGVMAIISWFVMVSKVSYLNGLSAGNAVFMREWQGVASDLTVLDEADPAQLRTLGGRVDAEGLRSMRHASVYRIYKIGSEEIRERLAADLKEGRSKFFASTSTSIRPKVLSARSIQAIRASLDGGLVRETQRINKLIVLLTICISGGPFLGLLGTVIGVMITFAAVAAAGDVNVNAIAPGIAAALLATVAGLAVAIPSLFGYNYILSRVKDATADMHVFIDEFVSKMAEFYSERAE